MAIIHCNDDGSNTAPYETWAKAATTFATAVGALSAGDDILIGADHAEVPGVNLTYTFPGTAAAPNRVISTTVGTTTYNKADNVQIDNGTLTRDISINGFVKFYGVLMEIGDDLVITDTPQYVLFDDCEIELNRASAALFSFGDALGRNSLRLKNTNVNFSGGASTSGMLPGSSARFVWEGGTLSWSGTQPTALFNGHTRNISVRVSGVDLSAVSTALVDVSDAADIVAEFSNCILNSGVSLTTGTISDVGTMVMMSGCDDTTGNDLYRFEYVNYYGSIVESDTIYRDDGASDGTNNISWQMVTTANAKEFSEPLVSPPFSPIWVNATGSTTFTVHVNRDDATDLDNDEIWLEIEYLGASADTKSSFSNDSPGDPHTAPTAQTTSTEAWTGTGGFSNENKQQLDVTVTINRVGPVRARIHLAKPSVTIYSDLKLETS